MEKMGTEAHGSQPLTSDKLKKNRLPNQTLELISHNAGFPLSFAVQQTIVPKNYLASYRSFGLMMTLMDSLPSVTN
jgi:hypothetical protein